VSASRGARAREYESLPGRGGPRTKPRAGQGLGAGRTPSASARPARGSPRNGLTAKGQRGAVTSGPERRALPFRVTALLHQERSCKQEAAGAGIELPKAMSQSSNHFCYLGTSLNASPWKNKWLSPMVESQYKGIAVKLFSNIKWLGLCISKPDIISLLEQGKEPWIMKRKMTQGQGPDLKPLQETKQLPPKKDFCEEKLSQALIMERLTNYSLECSILEDWGSAALFVKQPGLVIVGDVAVDFSQQKSFCKNVTWENYGDLGSVGHSVSKPDLVSLLAQGMEPWMVKRELTGGLFSGECGR
uniref:ZFP28 zinc finger protein n=1 Tax=Loxodonta africana TaxID=9785 RepID=G3UH37_LOXAF